MINKKMKESKTINLDYKRLQNKLDYEGFEKKIKPVFKPIWKLAVYSLCLCILSVIATLGIQNINLGGISGRDVTPLGKVYAVSYIEEGLIDELIAYGKKVTSQIILDSDLLNNHDKEEFRKFQNNHNIGQAAYDIFLGTKDGKDTIILATMEGNWAMFICESKLPYSFSSIVEDFEMKYDLAFTQEYLQCSVGECGIYIDFILKKDVFGNDEHSHGRGYKPYYVVKYQEQVYIVEK